ncbi:MAG: GNAT family protein [Bdellovibrionota bacterium]
MFSCKLSHEAELRPLIYDDVEDLFELTNSNCNYLKVWLPWVNDNMTIEDTRCFIESTFIQASKDNGFQAAIWFESKLVGIIGHHAVNRSHQSTSLGYWLGEEFQGRGLMTLACREFTRYSIEVMKMNRVEIKCAVGNFKSRAIPERLGYKMEGTLRAVEKLSKGFVDHVVYSMLASDWESMKSL